MSAIDSFNEAVNIINKYQYISKITGIEFKNGEEEFDIINSFEEDCMFPTKYIVRNINDVEYVKKIVNKIKK